MTFFQTEQLLNIFNIFKQSQTELFYGLILDVRCCRVGYAFIADNFIFLFADTPTGEYFLKPASAQRTDFDCLIQAHVDETKQAYAKF